MCRFIETIRIENKQLQHVEAHIRRMAETQRHFFGLNQRLDLTSLISMPASMDLSVHKCRILYDAQIREVSITPYVPKLLKKLKLISSDEVEYAFKFEDRSKFDELLAGKGVADEILLVKNGCITDTSYSNVTFYDGKNWYTPDTFLLNGTCRQRLLLQGKIHEMHITTENLHCFVGVKPINAMLNFEQTPMLLVSSDVEIV